MVKLQNFRNFRNFLDIKFDCYGKYQIIYIKNKTKFGFHHDDVSYPTSLQMRLLCFLSLSFCFLFFPSLSFSLFSTISIGSQCLHFVIFLSRYMPITNSFRFILFPQIKDLGAWDDFQFQQVLSSTLDHFPTS